MVDLTVVKKWNGSAPWKDRHRGKKHIPTPSMSGLGADYITKWDCCVEASFEFYSRSECFTVLMRGLWGLRQRGNGGTRVSCKHFIIKRIWGLTVVSEVLGAFDIFCIYVFFEYLLIIINCTCFIIILF
jgi:hypothetical protein